ncbi:MAG TPA: indole-3-glycerol phosphate synthase TrpC [Flavobacterium sp.]|nr:indole-3-glycerol phosphate synthase TrpC [Flavobacterium sp.]
MNILDKIIGAKRKEVALKKSIIPARQLEQSGLFSRAARSLAESIKNGSGIIAEHKRRSPSKAAINNNFSVEEVVRGYEDAGASGVSVLTDMRYFGGSLEDLQQARASISIPVLRKEFVIDEYQIIEAKSNGADAILLIAAVLGNSEIKVLSQLAQSLSLEVLLEVHNQEELENALMPSLDLVGVNNRNLKTFETSLDASYDLAESIPSEFVKVSESGIHFPEDAISLKEYGFKGFLIGETFMKTGNPGEAAKNFIKSISSRNGK